MRDEKIQRTHFLVGEGSPVLTVIEQASERLQVFSDAVKNLKAEFGGDVWSADNSQFLGIAFPGELPRGWRQSRQYAVPDKRIKAGRELAKRFASFPVGVNARIFSGMLSRELKQEFEYFGGGVIAWTGCEKYGDTYILSVPAELPTKPPGCRELKMSEYWRIREQSDTERRSA
ncbi:MAG TPA: hypothetical protein VN428_17660 [Bryobacteraceae bacterium]|nr:hypothetical protein [Bryobacteraceae bacterium]